MGQPFNKVLKVMVFVPILKADDGIEDLAIGMVTGAVRLEVPVVPHAIGADEVGGGVGLQVGKGLTALTAVGSLDGRGLRKRIFGPGKDQVQGAVGPFSGTTDG